MEKSMETKLCTKCKIIKDVNEFYKKKMDHYMPNVNNVNKNIINRDILKITKNINY